MEMATRKIPFFFLYRLVPVIKGANIPPIPKNSKIFVMFEPKMFPIIKPLVVNKEALILIANSGRDVPTAMIIKPINMGGTLIL